MSEDILEKLNEAVGGSKFLRHIRWEYAIDNFFHRFDNISLYRDNKKNKSAQKALAKYKQMEGYLQSFIDNMKDFEKMVEDAMQEQARLMKTTANKSIR